MKKLLLSIISALLLTWAAYGQTPSIFSSIAGKWRGTLEYSDYQSGRRVRMNVLITIEPASDGRSARISTLYDDFGKVIRSSSEQRVNAAGTKFFDGDTEFAIEAAEAGRLILIGRTQDGNAIERTRKTISYTADSLTILKETRDPLQFRNEYKLTRLAAVPRQAELSRRQAADDLAILKRALTALHPGLYRYTTAEAFDREFERAVAGLKDKMSEGELFVVVSQLLNKLNCGHTYTNPYNQQEALRTRLFGGRTYVPFYFDVVERRIFITSDASSAKLAAGTEITSINGIPAAKVIDGLLSLTKADGTNNLEHRLSSIALPRGEAERYALFDMYFPLLFPLRDEVIDLEVVRAGTSQTRKISVLAMTKAERSGEMTKLLGPALGYEDEWSFEIRPDGVGYLKMGNFLTWRFKEFKFEKFLEDAFAKLKAAGTAMLVIDIRGNGGGSMDPGFEVARYLARGPLPAYAAGRRLVRSVAAAPDLAPYVSTYDDSLLFALKNGVPDGLYRRYDDDYFEILGRENYPAVTPFPASFTGETFLLVDGANASAAFQFADHLQANKLATVVGRPTGGNKQGINGGNYFFLTLPASGVEVDIPLYFQSPGDGRRDEGVVPDVLVERRGADIAGKKDRDLEAVLQRKAR